MLILAVLAALLMPAAGQQLLDRVVARVGTAPITQTDVDAAIAFGVVDAPKGPDASGSPLQQLIERTLILAEVARFPPPEPAAASVDELAAAMKKRAGAQLDAVMKRTGLDDERIRELARDTLRIQAYINQRFGTSAAISQQEVRDYYDAHPSEFARDGVIQPFEQVEGRAREAAAQARRRATIDRWLADLRARGDVAIVAP